MRFLRAEEVLGGGLAGRVNRGHVAAREDARINYAGGGNGDRGCVGIDWGGDWEAVVRDVLGVWLSVVECLRLADKHGGRVERC